MISITNIKGILNALKGNLYHSPNLFKKGESVGLNLVNRKEIFLFEITNVCFNPLGGFSYVLKPLFSTNHKIDGYLLK